MSSTPSSKPASTTEVIQKEAKVTLNEAEVTREETETIPSPYLSSMASTSSSDSVSEPKTIQEMSGPFQIFQLPPNVLVMIFRFLDVKSLISSLFSTCKLFCPSFWECSVVQHPFLGYLGYIYEGLMFSKGVPISHLTMKKDVQSPYFRPNVIFSLDGTKQPAQMRFHLFTTSDSKEIRLEEIVSMVIKLSNIVQIDTHKEVLEFLGKLVKYPFERLRHLKLSGFFLGDLLGASLSKLSLDWLHLILPDLGTHSRITSFSGFKKLHMELWEDCDLDCFPYYLPCTLEEFSIHFSSQSFHGSTLSIAACTSLKKM